MGEVVRVPHDMNPGVEPGTTILAGSDTNVQLNMLKLLTRSHRLKHSID